MTQPSNTATALRRVSVACLLAALGALPTAAEEQAPRDQVARGNTTLGLKLLRALHTPEANTCVSPTSVGTALSMLTLGAKGETHTELRRALGVEKVDFAVGNRALLEALNTRKGMTLRVANAVFAREAPPIEADFVAAVKQSFQAHAQAIDFSAPDSLDTINGWVGKQTDGMIPNLLGSLSPAARAYLVNAVYFRADWATPFRHAATRAAPFHLANGETQDVKLMQATEDFACLDDDGARIARLPYAGGKASMWIGLPAKGATLEQLLTRLTPETLDRWAKQARSQACAIALPRLTLRFKQDVKPALRTLGLERSLGLEADYTGIAPATVISKVIHETVVEITEEGTRAAAATAIDCDGGAEPEPPFEVRCDRPFLYVIQDTASGAVLFAGTVTRP